MGCGSARPVAATTAHGACRYTECRLQRLAGDALLADLHPSVVAFTPNFDGSCEEPSVLPARIPQLLLNGSVGIAVGMATKIPPHNLRELVTAVKALVATPGMSHEALHRLVPGPDFPTGGTLVRGPGISAAYATGRGGMTVRSKVHVEQAASKAKAGREKIVVTELPYQVYKAAVIEEIAALVEKGTLVGVADVQDESDRQGMRIAIEVKRSASADVVLANLFAHTRLQSRFSANMVALVGGVPAQITLRDALQSFIDFRTLVRSDPCRRSCVAVEIRRGVSS